MQSLILRTSSAFLVGLLAVLSVFLLLRGHDHPGGGFVGGLLLAAAVAIRLLSHGLADAQAMLRIHPRTLVGIGLVIITTATCLGLVAGGPLLWPLTVAYVPVIGEVGTVLLFDLGVYVVVAGTTLTILFTLDREEA